MSAAVLTLVSALSLHKAPNKAASASAAISGQASYTPQPARETTKNIASTAAQAATAPTEPHPASQTPPPSAVTKAQTAHLSLATPSDTSKPGELNSALGGRTYSGSVSVDGYKVPLPAGDWVILSSAHFKSPQAMGELVFLGQVRKMRLIAGARVTALHTVNPPVAGFPPKLKGCYGQNDIDLYVAPEATDPSGHQACWLVDSFFTPPLQQWADSSLKLDKLDRAAAGDMAAKGVSYPQDFLRIRMTRTEPWGILEVSYLFSPDANGIKSNQVISAADSDWIRAHIDRFPEKLAYLEKEKRWATQFWPSFKAGFDSGSAK
jgi:hypothetical protein